MQAPKEGGRAVLRDWAWLGVAGRGWAWLGVAGRGHCRVVSFSGSPVLGVAAGQLAAEVGPCGRAKYLQFRAFAELVKEVLG